MVAHRPELHHPAWLGNRQRPHRGAASSDRHRELRAPPRPVPRHEPDRTCVARLRQGPRRGAREAPGRSCGARAARSRRPAHSRSEGRAGGRRGQGVEGDEVRGPRHPRCRRRRLGARRAPRRGRRRRRRSGPCCDRVALEPLRRRGRCGDQEAAPGRAGQAAPHAPRTRRPAPHRRWPAAPAKRNPARRTPAPIARRRSPR